MSTYGEKAEALFHDGYSCAQAVLLAFGDVTHLDEQTAAMIASPFGAGMGKLRETCGAFTGALMVLGAVEGFSRPHDPEAKRRVYGKVQELADQFRKENGSLICGELLGLRKPADGRELPPKKPCAVLSRLAADMLAEVLGLA